MHHGCPCQSGQRTHPCRGIGPGLPRCCACRSRTWPAPVFGMTRQRSERNRASERNMLLLLLYHPRSCFIRRCARHGPTATNTSDTTRPFINVCTYTPTRQTNRAGERAHRPARGAPSRRWRGTRGCRRRRRWSTRGPGTACSPCMHACVERGTGGGLRV